MAMVDVDGSSHLQVDSLPGLVVLVWGLAATWCWVFIHQMNRWTLTMVLVMMTASQTLVY